MDGVGIGKRDESDGVYLAKIEKPAKGWTAFFVELTCANGTATPFKLTTEMRVTPEVLPHKCVKPAPPR